MTPTLLAYQIEPGKLGRMQVVCLRLGIRVQVVDPADFGQPIGALAGVLPRNPDTPPPRSRGRCSSWRTFAPACSRGLLQGFAPRTSRPSRSRPC